MTALADALVQAQSRAVAALGKAAVHGEITEDELRAALDEIGLTDKIDQEYWIACLKTIKVLGASVPTNGAQAQPKQEPATQAQRERIKRDLLPLHGEDAAQHIASEPSLTKQQASEIIDQVKAGTFELERWWTPF